MREPFSETELPGTYHDANCASLSAQRAYISMFRWMLIASVLAAVCTASADIFTCHRQALSAVALILAVSAFFLTFILRDRKYEDTWYLGRAVAESIKTRTWRYMTAAEPYEVQLTADEADKRFIDDVQSILADNASLTLCPAPGAHREEITMDMRKVRASSLQERLQVYLECRIVNQRDWYGRKATLHAGSEGKLFTIVLLCQFIASAVAFYGIVGKRAVGGGAAVFAACATAFVAWLQVKKYQETAQAYSIASHDLSMAAALIGAVATEEQASRFVKESESAISREHTLWMARRNSRAKPWQT